MLKLLKKTVLMALLPLLAFAGIDGKFPNVKRAELVAANQVQFKKASASMSFLPSNVGAVKAKGFDAEVEYLESTGTQYIDTQIKPSEDLETYIAFSYQQITANTSAFGSRSSSSLNDRYWLNYDNKFEIGYGNWISAVETTTVSNINIVSFNVIANNTHIFTVNGRNITTTGSPNTTVNIIVFGRIVSGSQPVLSKMRLYSLSMKRNGILVRDFIPVRCSDVGFLYDKVSGQLFGNQGTGAFVVGPDLTARSYYQVNLIAMWDGIENAGYGVHDRNATNWQALVSGIALKLPANSTWSDTALHQNRTNYINTSIASTDFYTAWCNAVDNRTYTIENTYTLSEYGTSASTYLTAKVRNIFSFNAAYGLLCPYSASEIYYNSNQSGTGYYWSTQSCGKTDGSHSASASISPSGDVRVAVNMYFDGKQIKNGTWPTTSVTDANVTFAQLKNAQIKLGPYNQTTPNGAVDYIHNIRLYSKSLTADQIRYNYIIDKRRFNLP